MTDDHQDERVEHATRLMYSAVLQLRLGANKQSSVSRD